ncbi:hypothetical protein ACLI4Q_19975 [Natrialbaceae archaeon A-CW1-1]
MAHTRFVNREAELEVLESAFGSQESELQWVEEKAHDLQSWDESDNS